MTERRDAGDGFQFGRSMMCSVNDWAVAIRCSDILQRGHARALASDEPALLVPCIAQNPILCGGSVEHFSTDMPVWAPRTREEERLRPIDVLYGCYYPKTRTIDIFVNRISQDAAEFGADADELREVVRLHEHAHAVVHLGVRVDSIHKQMATLHGTRTAWTDFLDQRTSWFASIPAGIHEFLAQSLTYAALARLSSPSRAEKLQMVFEALEARQAPDYQLSRLEKQWALQADWRLVLDAARGTAHAYQGEGFRLRAGLAALLCHVAKT